MIGFSLPLLAVHVSDGVLDWPILALGFAGTAILVMASLWKLDDREIPKIALLTSAFFVASSIHVPIGPSSVHLLLNSLVGVLLGWRAPLAIATGVTLQAVLIPHGGISTIGINALAEILPALAAFLLYPWIISCCRNRWMSGLLSFVTILFCLASVVFFVALLVNNPWKTTALEQADGNWLPLAAFAQPLRVLLSPISLLGLGIATSLLTWLVRRLHPSDVFPAGAFLGALSVLATVTLIGAALVANGAEEFGIYANSVILAHIPLAMVEGFLLGSTLVYLDRVKPEMLPARKSSGP
ncbi:MAG: CbiM family transporter [Gemmataceae bacterium]